MVRLICLGFIFVEYYGHKFVVRRHLCHGSIDNFLKLRDMQKARLLSGLPRRAIHRRSGPAGGRRRRRQSDVDSASRSQVRNAKDTLDLRRFYRRMKRVGDALNDG